MRFSIIVPIYNISKYLPECINSIRSQDFKNFECVLVDDGSSDDSGKLCDVYVKQDKRFKVIHKENGGLVSARKAGARIAIGEYIINVDGDDFICADLLERLNTIIDQHEPETICYGYTIYNSNNNEKRYNICDEGLYFGSELNRITEAYLYDPAAAGINSGSILFNICSKCVKRELYIFCQEKVPDNITSGEDTLFTMNWCEKVRSVYFIKYAGYYYRQNQSSCEHSFTKDKFYNLYNLIEEMLSISKEHGDKYNNVIKVYLSYRLFFYCVGMGIYSDTYFKYRVAIKDSIDNTKFVYVGEAKIYKPTLQSRIKMSLLKHKKWLSIYWLSKTYFRDKLEL